MSTIPKYSSEVIQYIEAVQKHKLKIKYGPDFDDIWKSMLPRDEDFLCHIEKEVEEEFKDNLDERYELEARLKNDALEEVPNRTQYEFRQMKAVVNSAEAKFRYCAPDKMQDKMPYNATAYCGSPNAEIISPPELDKPIIFFDVELLSANLMFSKLYLRLISENPPPDDLERYKYFKIRDDEEAIKEATFCAEYFYNHYFSSTSKECPCYGLETPFQKSLLAVFLDTMGYYIYSHEVGHHVLRHSDSVEGKTTDELWKDELEADLFAMERMKELHKANEQSTILNFLGPLIFYRYLMLLELYNPPLAVQTTHPPTLKRVELYWDWLFRNHRPEHRTDLFNFLLEEQKLFELLTSIFRKIHSTKLNKETVST